MKKFYCTPGGIILPIMFFAMALVWIALVTYWDDWNDKDMNVVTIFILSLSLCMAIVLLPYCMRRVEIYKDKIVCKSILPSQTYEIEYEKCNLGIDYSWARNGNVWWLYICYGQPPRFKSTSLDRIAAMKYRPGFIKMHYSEELYNALLEVLPKQKRYSLMSAKKWAEKAKIKWQYN